MTLKVLLQFNVYCHFNVLHSKVQVKNNRIFATFNRMCKPFFVVAVVATKSIPRKFLSHKLEQLSSKSDISKFQEADRYNYDERFTQRKMLMWFKTQGQVDSIPSCRRQVSIQTYNWHRIIGKKTNCILSLFWQGYCDQRKNTVKYF